jgi:Fur family transcriptional regulator, ferric uptake regulator
VGRTTVAMEATGREEALARCRRLLRKNGGRCTQARLQVVSALDEARGHLTAAGIHERITAVGGSLELSTVYRALDRLMALELVHAVPARSGETTYGLVGEAHHHAVCRQCGSVVELPAHALAESLDGAARLTGFQLDSLVFSGLCARCRPV